MELMRHAAVPGLRLPVQAIVAGLAGTVALFVLSVAVAKLGAVPALAGIGALLIVLALCLLPKASAFVAVVILYSNVVVIFAGTPLYQVVGASSAILLALPVADQLLIRGQSPRLDRVFGLMVVFLIVLLLSAFAAEDIRLAIKEIVQYASEGMLIYVLVINVVRSPRDLQRVMAAGVLSCAVLSAMTIFQAATHQYQYQFGGLAQRIDAIQEVERRNTRYKKSPTSSPWRSPHLTKTGSRSSTARLARSGTRIDSPSYSSSCCRGRSIFHDMDALHLHGSVRRLRPPSS